jgi:hypothetical protein
MRTAGISGVIVDSVAIYPVPDPSGAPTFRAVAKTGQSEGRTAGEALDGIRPQLSKDNSCTVVVIQPFQPDAFFSSDQQQRLVALMTEWREARDQRQSLAAEKQTELEVLIAAELKAAELRTREVLQGLAK